MLGLGGILTEAIRDVTFRAVPVSNDEAREMPDSLRLKRLFDAQRGMPEIDRAILATVITGVGKLALDHPEITEIDINPLIVFDGKPIAVDALVVMEEPEQ
jgi:acyl-CoA synthetase (NDP forming)